MADLSVLLGRGMSRFARDRRFDGAEPDAPVVHASPALPSVVDPLTEAHRMGFADGLAAGRAEALAHAETERENGEALGFSFARIDGELAEMLRQRLRNTVVALCEATLVPLTLDLSVLAQRVKAAVAMFSRADDERVIRLNPGDLAAVQGMLPDDWTLLPDPALARGALRVETASGGAEDGPAQWRQAIQEALDSC
jgi:flagellar assembly protein FliH